jgi:hypothetical protein
VARTAPGSDWLIFREGFDPWWREMLGDAADRVLLGLRTDIVIVTAAGLGTAGQNNSQAAIVALVGFTRVPPGTSSGGVGTPDATPGPGSGRSASVSDGNRDGNDGSRQRPEAAVNSPVLSHIPA